jgi:protein involved in polysaccharide export with SLBB domain
MLESKNLRVWLAAMLLMVTMSCGSALSAAQEKRKTTEAAACTYHIGFGDQLEISVWRHPELSKTVVVDRKGNIRLPLVKVVKTSGLSVNDLEHVLIYKLESVFPKPQVTVIVSGINPAHLFPPQCLPVPELRWYCCEG